MKAVIVTKVGEPEVLQIQNRPMPSPKADEVLVKVFAAGVNRADVMMRKGQYGISSAAPTEPLGLEIAGVIVECGREVIRWKVGDKICALIRNGGYAEFAVADARHCFEIPENYSFEEAACLPETIMTIWSNVFQTMGLKKGENFLVHGGTSGIGVTAIQLAKLFGAKVYATAGSDEKCRFCEELGAEICVNYKTEDFEEILKPIGIDVILDYIGGNYTQKNINILNQNGRMCNIATLGGAVAQINIIDIMRKKLVLTGSFLSPQSNDFKAKIAEEVEEKVFPFILNGQYKAILYKAFDFTEAALAHKLMESSQHIGKIVLKIHQ